VRPIHPRLASLGQQLLFSVVAPVAARLPQYLLAGIAVIAGLLAYLFGSEARGAVDRNLRVVMPHVDARTRRRLTLATFVHGALGYVELFKLAAYGEERLMGAFQSIGWEHFDTALARGQGVIIVSAHVGSFSVAGQLFAVRRHPAAVVVEPLQPPELFARVAALRSRFGARLIPADRSSVRAILTALRANEIVGMMCDRDVTGSGDMMPIFGRPARVSFAPASFALRSGATVLPAVAYRTRPFQGVLRIDPPVELTRSGDTAEDVRQGMLQILNRIETMIRAAPQQWTMFTDVWPRPGYNGAGADQDQPAPQSYR
jgi:KDO2-lipid IV(A) lauroyltransferase